MGLLIYFVFLGLFIYGVYLIQKQKSSYSFAIVGFVFMVIQLLSVMGNVNVPYSGYSSEYFSVKFMYYIGILFFYIGYFIWAIISLALVYIPILVRHLKNKKSQARNENIDSLNSIEDNALNILINKLEEEKRKNK